jgi:drug/metabolite transporter (DMT)-like permease
LTLGVTLLVLLAAVLHAAWNALVRREADRLGGMARLALATSALSAPLLPFFDFPSASAWPFLGVTLILHTFYMLFLAKAYDEGALGEVYPLARGTAPLLVALVSYFVLGERLSPLALLAIAIMGGAIISLAWRGPPTVKVEGRPALYALITSLFIAAYTLVDGMGGRAAQSPHVYVVWLFFLYGYPILLITLWRRGPQFLRERRAWLNSGLGAAMSIGAYWIVIWAMKSAPLGPVAALRETSVIFAVLISAVILKEALTPRIYAAAVALVIGIGLLRA